MRTVSFSDSKLQNLFNHRFVNTFSDTFGETSTGYSIKHSPDDQPGPCLRGNGKQNVQTIFMTADGEVFHVATGFQSAENLMDEAEFALKLFREIQSSGSDQRVDQVVDSHRKRLGKSALENQSGFLGSGAPFVLFDSGTSRRGGSGIRTPFATGDMMKSFTQRGVDGDQQFSIDNPLLGYQQLQRNPALLVGKGTSFFASSGFGNNRTTR